METIAWWALAHLFVLQVCFQVGAGAIALAVVVQTRRRGTRVWFIPACALAAALLALNGLTTLTGVQTSSRLLNLLFPAAAFVGYCILATAAWSMRPRIVGIAAGTVAWVPLIVLITWFPIALAVVAAVVLDDVQAPVYTAQIRPGISCEGREWGGFAQDGHAVALYRYVPGFPFVRVEVARRSEQEPDVDYWPPDIGCAKLVAQVHP